MQIKQALNPETLRELARKYTFAAAAVGLILVMAAIVLLKDVVGLVKPGNEQAFASQGGGGQGGQGAGGGQGGGQRPGGAGGGAGGGGQRPGGAGGPGGGGGGALAVDVAPVGTHKFSDAVRALGTAQARESITVASKASDTIRALRFESGMHVKKGQILIEMANVEQVADLSEARAQLEVDKNAYDRYKELYDKGFSPKARLDQAEAALARSQSQVNSALSRIADRTIRAPFDGVVGLRTASPGMLVSPGTAIATLDDTSVIKLDFDIAESQMPKMKKDVPLIAHTAAFPNREFLGKIDQVDSRVNTSTRTVRVRALLPNPTGVLKPGMLMTVEVRSGESESLAVPEVSLSEVGDQVSVYRVSTGQGQPRLEQVNIGVGRRQDGMVEVLSGLNANDPIVTSGVVQARAGQPVRINQGGGARNGGGQGVQGDGEGQGVAGAGRGEGAKRPGQGG